MPNDLPFDTTLSVGIKPGVLSWYTIRDKLNNMIKISPPTLELELQQTQKYACDDLQREAHTRRMNCAYI